MDLPSFRCALLNFLPIINVAYKGAVPHEYTLPNMMIKMRFVRSDWLCCHRHHQNYHPCYYCLIR